MKKILTIFALVTILVFPGTLYAHTDSISSDSMHRAMGASTFEIMAEMEDYMMGADQHERMEELMTSLIDGTITADEKQEMINLMQDPFTGSGSMLMMMRTMTPYMAQQSSPFATTGMMGGTFPFYWITMVLVWVLLLSGIVAIWKWMNKKK